MFSKIQLKLSIAALLVAFWVGALFVLKQPATEVSESSKPASLQGLQVNDAGGTATGDLQSAGSVPEASAVSTQAAAAPSTSGLTTAATGSGNSATSGSSVASPVQNSGMPSVQPPQVPNVPPVTNQPGNGNPSLLRLKVGPLEVTI